MFSLWLTPPSNICLMNTVLVRPRQLEVLGYYLGLLVCRRGLIMLASLQDETAAYEVGTNIVYVWYKGQTLQCTVIKN